LGYLLSTFQGTAWLTTAWQDGLLQAWFPDATAEGLAQVAAIDRAAIALGEIWPDLGAELASEIRDSSKSRGKIRCAPTGGYRTWLTTAKLTNLLAAEPQTAEANLWRLKYSRAEIRAVVTVLKFLPQIQSVTSHTQLSRREQYFFFQGGGAVFPALAVLAVASGTEIAAIAPLIERYLTPNDPVAHPHSLLTGKDLMGALNLGAGPQIGQLLAAVQLAQAEGKVSTPEAALKFAAELIDSR
jgi:tRNA nucleotidyltransferase (CCA-adding enzyme)